jgi:hypothetical protein
MEVFENHFWRVYLVTIQNWLEGERVEVGISQDSYTHPGEQW